MWFGLLIREAEDGDPDLVTLVAWGNGPGQRIRVSGPPDGLHQVATVLRSTQMAGADFSMPRCPCCDEVIEDVPDLDLPLEEAA